MKDHTLHYELREPQPRVDLHPMGCGCEHCAPDGAALGFHELGRIALAAAVTGSAIAFSIDPAGSWAALRGIVGL